MTDHIFNSEYERLRSGLGHVLPLFPISAVERKLLERTRADMVFVVSSVLNDPASDAMPYLMTDKIGGSQHLCINLSARGENDAPFWRKILWWTTPWARLKRKISAAIESSSTLNCFLYDKLSISSPEWSVYKTQTASALEAIFKAAYKKDMGLEAAYDAKVISRRILRIVWIDKLLEQ